MVVVVNFVLEHFVIIVILEVIVQIHMNVKVAKVVKMIIDLIVGNMNVKVVKVVKMIIDIIVVNMIVNHVPMFRKLNQKKHFYVL